MIAQSYAVTAYGIEIFDDIFGDTQSMGGILGIYYHTIDTVRFDKSRKKIKYGSSPCYSAYITNKTDFQYNATSAMQFYHKK